MILNKNNSIITKSFKKVLTFSDPLFPLTNNVFLGPSST